MTRNEHADALKQRGFRLFPIRQNEKTPQFEGWQQKAGSYTTWWEQHPDSNIGVATGQGLLVLDFDVKKGGRESLALLDIVMGLPESYRVVSPSLGVHVYLTCPVDCGVTVSVDSMPDFPGVDVRCDGGLVVGAGSVIDGQPYLAVDKPLVAAPEWVLDLCRKAQGSKRRVAQSKTPLVELDRPSALARAADWLERQAPTATAGEGGNIATYKVAAWLRDLGISQAMAADLMFEHWNERQEPPWGVEELLQIIDNAYRYATGAPGAASALADFEAVEILEPVKKRTGLYPITFDEAAENALVRTGVPLVEGLLDTTAMVLLYGDSGSGKTFLMLDIAFHIAAGRPWQGRKVTAGLVVYVAAEGGRGILKRIAALRKHYDVTGIPLYIVPCPINLRDSRTDIAELLEVVKKAEEESGQPCVMVVVDTLSRALAGGDENTSTDMGAFVRNVDRIRASLKAAVAIVHHSGKDSTRGARGWSGLRAATDTEIEIIDRTIRISKQRDMDPEKDIRFTLDSVEIGLDSSGHKVTSCVVRVLTGTEFVKMEMTGAEAQMYEAFVERAKQKCTDTGLPTTDWQLQIVTADEWDEAFLDDSAFANRVGQSRQKTGTSQRTIRRLRSALVEGGQLRKVEANQWVST